MSDAARQGKHPERDREIEGIVGQALDDLENDRITVREALRLVAQLAWETGRSHTDAPPAVRPFDPAHSMNQESRREVQQFADTAPAATEGRQQRHPHSEQRGRDRPLADENGPMLGPSV
jgi:hypothetical protein